MGQEFVVVDSREALQYLGAEHFIPFARWAHQGVTIPHRKYAIAVKEITYAEFQEFVQASNQEELDRRLPGHAPSADCPVVEVPYHGALRYCRWLSQQVGWSSEQLGLPQINAIQSDMSLSENLVDFPDYRLPTPAEWQIAVRAGSLTDRFIGHLPEELPNYGNVATNTAPLLTEGGEVHAQSTGPVRCVRQRPGNVSAPASRSQCHRSL